MGNRERRRAGYPTRRRSRLAANSFQILRNSHEVLKRRLEVCGDFGTGRLADSSSAWSVSQKLSKLTLPRLVQLLENEELKTVAILAVAAVLLVVAADEVIQVMALEAVLFEGEMQLAQQIVDPEFLSPSLLLVEPAVEEQDVGLNALGVEDACG